MKLNIIKLPVVMAAILFAGGCSKLSVDSSQEKNECSGLDLNTRGNGERGYPSEKVKAIFEAANSGNWDTLFDVLPEGYGKYRKLINADWRIKCLEINYTLESDDFMYSVFSAVELDQGIELETQDVFLFYKEKGVWHLANFPFPLSGIDPFDVIPIWGSKR